MEYPDAVRLMTHVIQRARQDRELIAPCPHGDKSHGVRDCATAYLDLLTERMDRLAVITAEDVAQEALAAADG